MSFYTVLFYISGVKLYITQTNVLLKNCTLLTHMHVHVSQSKPHKDIKDCVEKILF